MQLTIDGRPIEAQPGDSLLCLVKALGLDTDRLSTRPLAARIAGETFTLNYVPVRPESGRRAPQVNTRRALRASNGEVSLIRYDSARGHRVYERTMLFVYLMAVKKLFPAARVIIEYAVGAGLYSTIEKEPALSEADTVRIKREAKRIARADYKLERKRLDIDDAIEFFERDGQPDKVRLLQWRKFTYFDVYRHGDYMDYFYGEMAPSTGYASVFDIVFHAPGLMLIRPDEQNPDVPASFTHMPNLTAVFSESDRWGHLMRCGSVADLNDLVKSGKVRELIRINEALHEKKYAAIADEVVKRGARAVMIAGPSSSGKTTSANRLCTQLRALGKSPVLISLDDYYIDRDKILPDKDGKVDLEDICTIDVPLCSSDLKRLLAGETVDMPRFDFVSGKRVYDGTRLRLTADTPLVIEGLHALNPSLLPESIDLSLVFKLYVSALTTLNLDDHNRIPTTYIRLLRRMVRDYETRGASVERTLLMWDSVRRGEEKWIFPYQESADAIFNTALVYEPAVLKKHIFPLLSAVQPDSPCYDEVRSIVKVLNYFLEANVEDEIPPTSILREFIGGNTFYRV